MSVFTITCEFSHFLCFLFSLSCQAGDWGVNNDFGVVWLLARISTPPFFLELREKSERGWRDNRFDWSVLDNLVLMSCCL